MLKGCVRGVCIRGVCQSVCPYRAHESHDDVISFSNQEHVETKQACGGRGVERWSIRCVY